MDTWICTVVTKSYLPRAPTLAQSVKRYHPEMKILVLLVGPGEAGYDPGTEPFQAISLEDLPDQPTIWRMAFYYNTLELCCAVRPFLQEYMLNQLKAEQWLFLDPDIYILGSLEPVFTALEKCAILLTPHQFTPCPPEQAAIWEISTMFNAGIFNGGFLGLRDSIPARAFINWHKSRLTWFCFMRPPLQFVDQKWLDLVPIYFRQVAILRHPGINAAYWNLHGRRLHLRAEGWRVDNAPLLLLHYSGWDPNIPDVVTKHRPRLRITGWKEMTAACGEELLANGHQSPTEGEYLVSEYADGAPIAPEQRRAYYQFLRKGGQLEGSPLMDLQAAEAVRALPLAPPPTE